MRRAALTFAAMLIASLLVAAPAVAEPAVALTPNNSLLLFDTAAPATTTSVPVTGLGAGETLRGIDQRPTSLELVGSTVATSSAANSIVRTYTIDPVTGAATLIGATAAALAGAADVPTGFDFNPLVDRIRYVNTNDENARLNPLSGGLAGNDTDLTPALAADIIGEAYDHNIKDAETTTTLFAINRSTSSLGHQGSIGGAPTSPNAGVITDIAPLGFTLSAAKDGGFDITREGTAYAGLSSSADSLSRLYTIDLTTGTATVRGFIGNGSAEIRGLTILSSKPAGVAAPVLPAPVVPPVIPVAPAPLKDTTPPNGLIGYVAPLKLATLLASGLRPEFSCSEACSVSARLRLGKVSIATGSAKRSTAGIGRVRLKVTSQGRRTRLRGRVGRAELFLTLSDSAGNKAVYSRRVTLR